MKVEVDILESTLMSRHHNDPSKGEGTRMSKVCERPPQSHCCRLVFFHLNMNDDHSGVFVIQKKTHLLQTEMLFPDEMSR